MKLIKYSKQREAIKTFLEGRKDHPTADMVYMNIREEYPNISLGTVYRNLALLDEMGEIQKISCGDNADRFDGNARPHTHFSCVGCKEVSDIDIPALYDIDNIAGMQFEGEIQGHSLYFYGYCAKCAQTMQN